MYFLLLFSKTWQTTSFEVIFFLRLNSFQFQEYLRMWSPALIQPLYLNHELLL